MTSFELLYVVDTHALIWYLLGSKHLSQSALTVFDAAALGDTFLVISAITIAELYYADKKHGLFQDFTKMYETLKSRPELYFEPFKADDVQNFDVSSSIPEMHDRIIAGAAYRLNAPLITSDPLITASGLVRIIW